MINVGVVVYTQGESPGMYDAQWSHSTNGSGTGRLTGGPASGVEGIYKALYFDEQGKEKFSLNLTIRNQGDQYALAYTLDGETICTGLGKLVGDSLVAGYTFSDAKWLDRQ